MNLAIYEELKRVATGQDVTTYGAIAPLADLDMADAADRNAMAAILGEISAYEHRHRRPLLSAVVVLQDTGVPGVGFFTLAKNLGLYEGDDDFGFFRQELERVHAAWRSMP